MDVDSRTGIYGDAIDQYLAEIPDSLPGKTEIRAELLSTTLPQLMKEIKVLENRFSGKSQCRRLLERCKPVFDQLERFSKVFEVCIQAKPEVTALIWGGLKLLLQLAVEFSQFFEKLLYMLQKITNAIPHYEEYHRIYKEDPLLNQSLKIAYTTILEFWGQATKIFIKEKDSVKKMKNTASIMASIAWTPFDARFRDIIRRFEDDSKAVNIRVQLAQSSEMRRERDAAWGERMKAEAERHAQARERSDAEYFRQQMTERMEMGGSDWCDLEAKEERRKEKSRGKIISWLGAVSCLDMYEQLLQSRTHATGSWIFRREEYARWLNASNSNTCQNVDHLMWINGKAGCGKTFLAAHIVEQLLHNSENSNIVYFLCNYRYPQYRSELGILSTLLSQVLQLHRDNVAIIDAFLLALTASTTPIATSTTELWQLFEIVLQLCPMKETYCVIDGLDECDINDLEHLTGNLSSLSQRLHGSLKVLILGRSADPYLDKAFRKHITLQVVASVNYEDLFRYVDGRTSELFELGVKGFLCLRRNEIVRRLLQGANGMFLWARLMLDILCSPALLPEERTRLLLVSNLPDGLESLYKRILDVMCTRIAPERNLAAKIFSRIAFAERPMTISELSASLMNSGFAEVIITTCGGLIELASDQTVQFIHLSVKEFLVQQSNGFLHIPNTHAYLQFCPDEFISHILLAEVCSNAIAGVSASPLPHYHCGGVVQDSLAASYPLINYASTYWLLHFRRALLCKSWDRVSSGDDSQIRSLIDRVAAFVDSRERKLVWLEICYVFKNTQVFNTIFTAAEAALSMWTKAADPDLLDLANGLYSFARDTRTLHEGFGTALSENPGDIWTGMTDFLTGSTLNENPHAITICAPEPPSETGILNEFPLVVKSEISSDGKILGVASVWAPKAFHQLPAGYNPRIDIKSYCRDWILKIDKWDINSRELHEPLEAFLDCRDMYSQLAPYRSRVRDMQVPVSFSSDLRLVVIFTMVYETPPFDTRTFCTPERAAAADTQPRIQSPAKIIARVVMREEKFEYYRNYNVCLSSNGNYLAYYLVRRWTSSRIQAGPGISQVGVYTLRNKKDLGPLWQHNVEDLCHIPGETLELAMHPFEPLVAWSTTLSGTSLARFDMPSESVQVSRVGTVNLAFSSCGSLLCGQQNEAGVFFAIPPSIRFPTPRTVRLPLRTVPEEVSNTISEVYHRSPLANGQHDRIALSASGLELAQHSSSTDKMPTAYTLQNIGGNDVRVARLCSGGVVEQRPITRLPDWLSTGSSRMNLIFNTANESRHQPVLDLVVHPSQNPQFDQSMRDYPTLYRKQEAAAQPWEGRTLTAKRAWPEEHSNTGFPKRPRLIGEVQTEPDGSHMTRLYDMIGKGSG